MAYDISFIEVGFESNFFIALLMYSSTFSLSIFTEYLMSCKIAYVFSSVISLRVDLREEWSITKKLNFSSSGIMSISDFISLILKRRVERDSLSIWSFAIFYSIESTSNSRTFSIVWYLTSLSSISLKTDSTFW